VTSWFMVSSTVAPGIRSHTDSGPLRSGWPYRGIICRDMAIRWANDQYGYGTGHLIHYVREHAERQSRSACSLRE